MRRILREVFVFKGIKGSVVAESRLSLIACSCRVPDMRVELYTGEIRPVWSACEVVELDPFRVTPFCRPRISVRVRVKVRRTSIVDNHLILIPMTLSGRKI